MDANNDEVVPLVESNTGGRLRWLALVLMCLISLGSCYCYDNPAALNDVLIRDLKIPSSVYTSFYSWYSWPNVVLCLFGGILIDHLGRRPSTILFSFLVMLGQLMFASGAFLARIWLMQLGRVIFGIGGESLGTVINTFLASWFLHKELNFAFGFMLSFARVGSSVNMYLTRPLYNYMGRYFHGNYQIGITLLLIVGVCLISFLAAISLVALDKHRVKVYRIADERNHRAPNFRAITKMPMQLWLLALSCVCYYVSIFPFVAIGVKFFHLRNDVTPEYAGFLDSSIFIFSAILAPMLGMMVDKIGRNLYFVLFACLGTVAAHLLMAVTFVHPLIPMIFFGISYSIMSAFLWPMVVLIVPQSSTGTAYGLMFAIQNLGMALMNMVSGYIIDFRGFFFLQVMMISMVLYSFLFVVLLINIDYMKGVHLNLPASVRRELSLIQRRST